MVLFLILTQDMYFDFRERWGLVRERERERGRGRERERERNISRLFPVCAPTGDQTCNLGVCPDRE